MKIPFKYKDIQYTIQLGIHEQQYSLSNCGMIGLSHIEPRIQYIYSANMARNHFGSYLGEEIQKAFWLDKDSEEWVYKTFMEKYGQYKFQIVINDAVNTNTDYWHTKIMEWLRNNAEKHGGTIWAGPLSPNPTYVAGHTPDMYHMTQLLIWIPNSVPTCTSRKSPKTGKWYTNPSKEQVDGKILPKTRIYTKN